MFFPYNFVARISLFICFPSSLCLANAGDVKGVQVGKRKKKK